MKRFPISLAFVILILLAMPLAMPVLAAQDGSSASESDVYVVSSDTKVIGPPLPAPEPPRPIAAPEPVPPEEDHTPPGTTPRPESEYYPMPDAVWRPKPEPIIIGAPRPEEPTPPEWGPVIVAVERVLPCPPEPVMSPFEGAQAEDDSVLPPPWEPKEEPADEIFVAALPPWTDAERGCIIYCTLGEDTISISIDSVNDISPKLFIFDTTTCRAEVKEPKAHGYFEVERPRGTRLFLTVFDSEGVIYKITVWTPPSPSAP